MRVLLGLAILVTLALAASSKRFYSIRRTRLGAALLTGGWVMVAVGVLIGPYGAQLVDPEHIDVVKPLIIFLLSWVGVMVGLQVDRRIPTMVPRPILALSAVDAAVSVVLLGGATWAVLTWRSGAMVAALPQAVLLGACAVGWAAEVRSLRIGQPELKPLTLAIRAGAGLSSILALVVYGLVIKSYVVNAGGEVGGLSALLVAQGLGASLAIGIAMGLVGMWLMGLAGRNEAEFLVVLLGVVSFTAGAAATMGYAPLFVGMLCGATVTNLSSKALEPFKRGIAEGEQPIAMALMLVAGVMADPFIGVTGWIVLGVVLVVRIVVKFALVRWRLRDASGAAAPWSVFAGVMRQSPIAIALAVGYAVSPLGSASGAPLDGPKVLTIVILSGVVAEVWPFLHGGGAMERSTVAPTKPKPSSPAPGEEEASASGPVVVTDTPEVSEP